MEKIQKPEEPSPDILETADADVRSLRIQLNSMLADLSPYLFANGAAPASDLREFAHVMSARIARCQLFALGLDAKIKEREDRVEYLRAKMFASGRESEHEPI